MRNIKSETNMQVGRTNDQLNCLAVNYLNDEISRDNLELVEMVENPKLMDPDSSKFLDADSSKIGIAEKDLQISFC